MVQKDPGWVATPSSKSTCGREAGFLAIFAEAVGFVDQMLQWAGKTYSFLAVKGGKDIMPHWHVWDRNENWLQGGTWEWKVNVNKEVVL